MTRSRTKDIVLVALTVALTTAGAYLRLPIGLVPISLQTLFVLLSGAILGPWVGAAAMASYIVLGLSGLPLFTGGGGPQYILSPTFGFLLSFPLASMVVGLIIPPDGRYGTFRRLVALVSGTLVIYLVGVPWLGLNLHIVQEKNLGAGTLMMMGMVPFLPGDLLKVVFATLLIEPVRRALPG
ncbi:MAG: biotin transporter BioY [bacterium]|nr:biotin transporter BioY [bacterium]MDT8395139.1 biotin transporter BioY [bacterium]